MKNFNLVVPLAGKGQRMIDGGFDCPKPLLMTGHKTIIEWSMDSIDYSNCNLIFVVRQDHIDKYDIKEFLLLKYPECQVVPVARETTGAIDSVCEAKHLIQNEKPLIIFCPDVSFLPHYTPLDLDFCCDGFLLTFKANSPNYSYVVRNHDGYIVQAVEKKVVSNEASVGVYCFRSGNYFLDLLKDYQYEKESYVCPLYNEIIKRRGTVDAESVSKIYIMGTPEERDFFINAIHPYLKLTKRTFALCSDHSGFWVKEKFKNVLTAKGVSHIDVGCNNDKDCDYNEYVNKVTAAVSRNLMFGIGFCKTGQGINICANKIKNVRAALIHDATTAEYAIRHNAANFFSIPNDVDEIEEIVKILQTATFDGGRFQNRMMKNHDSL